MPPLGITASELDGGGRRKGELGKRRKGKTAEMRGRGRRDTCDMRFCACLRRWNSECGPQF